MILVRRLMPGIALLMTVLLVAACGGGGAGGPDASSAPGTGAAVTIQHKFGETVITGSPQRVVSLGYTDQDAILALGVVPVGIREFTGNQPSATWPWARDRLQGQQPQVLGVSEVDVETLAALRPDLIIGVSAGLTAETYASYSRIAPVIAQPTQYVDYGTPWQDATRIIGQALGRSAEAERLVSDVERQIADVVAQNPTFRDRTIAGVRPSTTGSSYFVWGPQDLRARFFQDLGLQVPGQFAQMAGDSFYAEVSVEQLVLLDQAEVVALITSESERALFTAVPGFAQLAAVQRRSLIAFDDEEAAALSFSSVLSLPAILDSVPAKLAAALSGQAPPVT